MAIKREGRKMKVYVSIVMIIGLLLVGCSAGALTGVVNQASEQESPTEEAALSVSVSGDVLMLGRSVMAGWFMYWGGQGETGDTYKRDGFTLRYGHMETPPNIVNSAKSLISQFHVGPGWIVFFKFCFEDFAAGSPEEVAQTNARNERYVEEVYNEVCKNKGAKLIIGNALPQVKEYTTKFLIQGHKEYNAWLLEFAKAHPGEVFIFDMYSILTTEEGYLKPEYAASPTDSHLNNNAYKALTEKFFPFLKAYFKIK